MKGDRGGKRGGAYGHSEDGVRGLEAVGALLPEVPLIAALDSGDVAAGASAGLRDEHVADTVPRGQRLRGAEAADAAAHHDAVRGQLRAGRGRRLGRVTGHRTANAVAKGTRNGSRRAERWRRRGDGHGDHFLASLCFVSCGVGDWERGGVDDATRCALVSFFF
jgi:hypothetical protein